MNLTDTHVLNVIKFQRKYRFLKNELDSINQRLVFLKDYLLNQINNISFLRTYGIVDQNNISIEIINELKPCIELFKNSYLKVISPSTKASEPFIWKPELSTSVFGTNYKLRIKDVDDIANSFESSDFKIIKPSDSRRGYNKDYYKGEQ